MNYPKVPQDIAKAELEILEFWKQNDVFKKSVEMRSSDSKEFVFYDGPPFANGLPHYGHLLTGFIKDVFARYQTMKGSRVERRFGWDTHGLPVEMEVEKELGVSGQIAIKEYGIDKFNEACKKSVMKYSAEWKNYVERQGRWVDFDGGYKTMDLSYMESVIWAFKRLFDMGLIYEDFRVVPYSWACQTPLSNFETRMDNSYRMKESKAVTVKFKLLHEPRGLAAKLGIDEVDLGENINFLVWTTTPWTLPSNLAIAVGAEIEYAFVVVDNTAHIMAKGCVAKNGFSEDNIVATISGATLVGMHYEPLFPYFSKLKDTHSSCFTVLAGDFVATDEGTGIVHMAPGFGEDDQTLCKAHAIPTVCPVDEGGKFCDITVYDKPFSVSSYDGLPELIGRQVFETNDDIIKHLKIKGFWHKTEQYLHNYPHCWRTDTPLIYKAVSSWYVSVTKIKEKMVRLNAQGINWIPDHIRDGQFGKWLANARDWSITRNRFWGCPVPVWRSDNPKYPRIDVYGSTEELERDFGVKVDDLHRPYIDDLVRNNPDDPTGQSKMRRVTDVLDCWFESGSMSYAQAHYPFENKEWFEKNFPADFITEYLAQTRGWFYTMMVLSTALFNKVPFKNVICHGTILDEKSQKLSKRLKNYPDPLKVFDEYGSDAMRFFMVAQVVMRGQELKIDKDGRGFRDAYRISIKPILNAYSFFSIYANADKITASRIMDESMYPQNFLDVYILSKLRKTVSNVDSAMSKYDTVTVCEEFDKFFEVLNNWYIRRSRNRFWKSEADQDKTDAYNTLYTVLLTTCEAFAPIIPFVSEVIWKGLKA